MGLGLDFSIARRIWQVYGERQAVLCCVVVVGVGGCGHELVFGRRDSGVWECVRHVSVCWWVVVGLEVCVCGRSDVHLSIYVHAL